MYKALAMLHAKDLPSPTGKSVGLPTPPPFPYQKNNKFHVVDNEFAMAIELNVTIGQKNKFAMDIKSRHGRAMQNCHVSEIIQQHGEN